MVEYVNRKGTNLKGFRTEVRNDYIAVWLPELRAWRRVDDCTKHTLMTSDWEGKGIRYVYKGNGNLVWNSWDSLVTNLVAKVYGGPHD